jgi:cysteinyl-tRNA synthetase
LNRFIDSEGLEEPAKRTPDAMAMLSTGMAIFKEMSSILGIFVRPPKQSGGNEDATQLLDGLMQLVIQLRSDARAKRDFATSDSVRNGLTQIGITLQDGKNGTTWEVNK